MARLQLLYLPADTSGDGGETTPFVLVVDELTDEQMSTLAEPWSALRAADLGARGVVLFPFTVDVV